MTTAKLSVCILVVSLFSITACNQKNGQYGAAETTPDGSTHHHHNMNMPEDQRISLGVTGMQQQHQLINMRNHVAALQSIIDLMSKDKYDQAAEVAHSQLGLTEEMKMMCTSFGNEEFSALGLAFHKSGDQLGETLKTGNKNESLKALAITINYCVNCHAKFKQ